MLPPTPPEARIYIYIYKERETERETERERQIERRGGGLVHLQVSYTTCTSLSHIHTLYIIHGGRLSADTCHNAL